MIGSDLRVRPRAALSLTMAVNEFATNAAKYGALSTETGELRIERDIVSNSDGAALKLGWRERGGPPASAPSRLGFGTRLIRRCIEGDLGGRIEMTFGRAGLVCTIVIAMTSLCEG